MKDVKMSPREERLLVIENIKNALIEGNSFKKVELFDPVITEEDIKRTIVPFDTERRRAKSRLLSFISRKIAESEAKKLSSRIEIYGLENALSLEGGAIITQNHFNPEDSLPARLMAMKLGKEKDLHIIVQQTNVFMTGFFGFLMKNCNTLPVSDNLSYMAKNLKPAIKNILDKKGFILVYPEQEMWFNYKKPREARDGAYHYAAEFGAPILPCFVTMKNTKDLDINGFYTQKYTLHVMPPIYPDKNLSVRENRENMKRLDTELKRNCYESFYGAPAEKEFEAERDIAGFYL